jgi:uncharacterized protein YutE (UPF0331/DUF86 family)
MINKMLITNKLADIQAYYLELSEVLKSDFNDILGNNLKLRSTERLFQLIVDTAIDINTHIISEMNLTVPDDYQSTFISLGENKILPMDFANKIAPSVGLRNLIVHKYGRTDLIRMIIEIKSEIDQYAQFMKHIKKFLDSK